jgi:hypothetical protein
MRTYTQMLLVGAPLLIEAPLSRAFLETAHRVAAELIRTLRDVEDRHMEAQLNDAFERLRAAASPLLEVLNGEELEAVT